MTTPYRTTKARTAAQPPYEDAKPIVRDPATSAAGLAAVVSTARALPRMGLTRGVRTLLAMNQHGGFDCPGCAWPEPRNTAIAEFCENGAKHAADEATLARVTPDFFGAHSVEELAAQSDAWLNAQGRLTHPMILRDGATHYEAVSWDEAFRTIAGELRALGSPDEAIFYTSGRTSNEAAFLYQLFVRQLGTNNLPDCSNMCHESSGTALRETLGVAKGTVRLEDFEQADCIVVLGQNPGTNHPRMLSALEAAARRGCTIVTVNPIREAGLLRFAHPQDVASLLGRGTEITTHYVQVRINGDLAFLQGVAKAMLALEARAPGTVVDHAFVDAHASGFEAYAEAIGARSWEALEAGSGVPRATMERIGRVLAASERTIACWAMGLTQHENGVANVQEVVNVLLLRGNVGRAGAGVCPVRGHSNVQGDRTMGIWEQMPDAFLDRLGETFGFEPPRHHGLDTIGAIHAMLEGRAQLFFALGGNFLSATPDTERTAEALRRCRLTVHVSTKLHRGHLVTGRRALILPCLGRTERDVQAAGPQVVTVEDSMGVVHASQGRNVPASPELLSEPMIVARLAHATLGDRSRVPWHELAADYDRIRDAIEAVVPGFEGYNGRARERGGFALPDPARERRFETSDGRAHFTVNEPPVWALRDGELLMMTIRSHDQFNTTVYTGDDRYRGIERGRRVVLMHEADAAARGLGGDGEEVDLVSHFRGETRIAERFRVVRYPIARGCVATYFPEANVLVPLDAFAAKSRTPASKSVVVTVRRREAAR